MRGWIELGIALAVAGGPAARGQVVERDTRVTGPRGRTIERDVRITRGPGFVERDIDIRRPAGEFRRETIVRGGPGGFRGPGPAGFVGNGFGPGPRIFVERDVFVAPPPPSPFGGFLGPLVGFALGTATGSALTRASSPPPPAYYGPPAPPPVVVYNQPQRYQPGGPQPAPPPTVVVDPVADAMAQLQSSHAHTRRDAALALGRLGDVRSVPALVECLKNDRDKDVRIASAWSLAEIGDPKAGVFLERAALYDKKKEVRDVAARAYQRLPREVAAPSAAPSQPVAAVETPPLEPPTTGPSATPPPPPTPAGDPSGFREGP